MMTCATCSAELKDGQPHCSKCGMGDSKSPMKCEGEMCKCEKCGNEIKAEEAKCDACLATPAQM